MTFTADDIRSDDYFIDFLSSRPLAESTLRNYVIRIKNYSNFLGMLPREFIEEAEEEQDNRIKTRKRIIKNHLNSFARYMERQKYSITTVDRSITDIKTFYHYFDIDTPSVKTKKQVPSTLDDLPTLDEVKKAIRNANARDKAIVLLHLSSGMGSAELRNLKYHNFLNAIGAPTNTEINDLRNFLTETTIPAWRIVRIKTGYEYHTFSSPECAYAIVDYLEERNFECEWLFTPNNCKQLTESTHMNLMRRINDKNGFGFRKKDKQRRFSSHQLRRLFTSSLYNSKVDKSKIDYMLGHDADRTSAAYFKNDPGSLKEDYIKGLDAITVLSKIELIKFAEPQVQLLMNEMDTIKKEKDEEIALLKKRMDLMQNILDNRNVREELDKR